MLAFYMRQPVDHTQKTIIRAPRHVSEHAIDFVRTTPAAHINKSDVHDNRTSSMKRLQIS